MECNPTRVCELLVGLPEVNVLGVDDGGDRPLRVHVESRVPAVWCRGCGSRAAVKDRPRVELVDLPCFGRPTRLVWPQASVVLPRVRGGFVDDRR